MIYSKDAAFSYPILSHSSTSYDDCYFYFNIDDIVDEGDAYSFTFSYDIESEFIKDLVKRGAAVLILIIQSDDNVFFELKKNQTHISIPKSRLTFDNKVLSQLHIQSLTDIDFSSCQELHEFYASKKEEIKLGAHTLLAYSNVSAVKNMGKEGVQLFEKAIDPSMSVDYEAEVGTDQIILKFREERFLLQSLNSNRHVMNLYLYQGLEMALQQFILEHLEADEEILILEDLESSTLNNLHDKLYQLLIAKGVEDVNLEQLDVLVQTIAPDLILKFTQAIERLCENGD